MSGDELNTLEEKTLHPHLYPVGSKAALMTQTVLVKSTESMEDDSINLREMLNQLELQLIREALNTTNGVVTLAAKKLGLRRTTLIEKIKRFKIAK